MDNVLTLNGNMLTFGGNALTAAVDPYNPLGLPPFTIRCKFASGYTPTVGDSQTLVDAGENIWDITKNSTSWSGFFQGFAVRYRLISVLGANSTGVTNMGNMFDGCENLESVALFDTSSAVDLRYMYHGTYISSVPAMDTSSCTNMAGLFSYTSLVEAPVLDTSHVTTMNSMFYMCTDLRSIPLYDTSHVADFHNMLLNCISLEEIPAISTASAQAMDYMCYDCHKVNSGALALYTQASTQATPPTVYNNCFSGTGRDSVTGSAEVAQIPASWGGTGA